MASSLTCYNPSCRSGTDVKLKVCSACSLVYYCGKVCQKSHWKVHQKNCKQTRKDTTRFLENMKSQGLIAGPLKYLDEEEKDKIRIQAFLDENSNPGAIEVAAKALGEHPLVIGGGSIEINPDGQQRFIKGDVVEEKLPGGQTKLTCQHGCEMCHICCVDYKMINDMAR